MRNILKLVGFFAVLILFTACYRQKLEEEYKVTALIPVKVLWENSGIEPSKRSEGDYVNRVAFRFFPKDGSKPFEQYLESNIHEGFIEVPLGNYSLVVTNESVTDNAYWSDYMMFSNINEYSKMSVSLLSSDPKVHDYYVPKDKEQFMIEAPKLASWSVDDFEVTAEMVTRTRRAVKTRDVEGAQEYLLTVDMQRLTYECRVVADVQNLSSVHFMRCAVQGFSKLVYLASRKTDYQPATLFFKFNGRKYNNPPENTDGTTEYMFLTFGCLPHTEQYDLEIDVIFINGTRYEPDDKNDLLFDVTGNVVNSSLINIDIPIALKLPKVDGNIGVGDWDDDETIIIK